MRYTRTAIGLLTAQYRSVLRKCMLINLGLFALAAPMNVQAEPSPVLPTLHEKQITIPSTNEIYPSGLFVLLDATEADADKPNVFKYYNPNTGDATAKYYAVGLKYSEIGTGSAHKYYTWVKDASGVRLAETASASNAVLKISYNPNDVEQIVVNPDTEYAENDGKINNVYMGQDVKNVIDNYGVIKSITSQFIGNDSVIDQNDNDRGYAYSSILVESQNNAKINDLQSSFIGNKVTINQHSNKRQILGSLIKTMS